MYVDVGVKGVDVAVASTISMLSMLQNDVILCCFCKCRESCPLRQNDLKHVGTGQWFNLVLADCL